MLTGETEDVKCLLKHGFGISKRYIPTLVGEPSHFSIDITDCGTKCEKLVKELFEKSSRCMLSDSRMSVLTLYQSPIAAHCTKKW